MDRPSKIAQAYGYIVCLITVITFLISLNNAIGAVFDLSDPLTARAMRGEPSMASFELYRSEMERYPRPTPLPDGEAVEPMDEARQRALFEAAREDRIRATRFQAYRSLVTAALLMVVAVALFTTHWIWLRRQGSNRTESTR